MRVGGILIDVAMNTAKIAESSRETKNLLERTFTDVGQKINNALKFTAAIASVYAVQRAIKDLHGTLTNLAAAGETAGSIRNQFEQLGGTADTIERAKASVLGMVDSFELMRLQNQAMIAGVPEVNKHFAAMAELGGRIADATGISMTQGIEKVNEAMKKASSRGLSQIGILIDQEKAYENYARQLGTEAKLLSESDQLQARRIAALEQIREKTQMLGEVSESTANAQTALSTAFDEAYKTIGIQVNESEDLAKAYRDLANAVDDLDWEYIGRVITAAFESMIISGKNLLPVLENIIRGFDTFFNLSSEAKVVNIEGQIKNIEAAITRAEQAAERLPDIGKKLFGDPSESIPAMEAKITSLREEQQKLLAATKETKPAVGELKTTFDNLGTSGANAGEKTGKALMAMKREAEKAAAEAEKLRKEWQQTIDSLHSDILKDGIKIAIDLKDRRAFESNLKDLADIFGKNLKEKLQNAIEKGVFTEEQADRFYNVMRDRFIEPFEREWTNKLEEAETENGTFLDGFWGKFSELGSDAATGFSQELGAQVFDALANGVKGLSDALRGDGDLRIAFADMATGMADAVGMALGIPFIGPMLDPFFQDLVQIGKNTESTIKGITSASLNALVPGLGVLDSFLGNPIGGQVEKIWSKNFGGTTEGEALGRQSFERWLEKALREAAEAGSRLSLRDSEGKFRPFEGNVVFGGSKSIWEKDGWDKNYEQRFDPNSRGVFQALGIAMTEFTGLAEDQGGKIGLVLQENLLNNLDNARLMLQTLGISVEELGEALFQAARQGEMSWLEFEVHMQNMSQLAGEGLVGVGDLEGAFLQLEASGGRGMQALIALQNLSIEAMELGITTVDELGAQMVQSGLLSAERWEQFAAILQNRGITTLEQLGSTEERVLGGIIADLDANVNLFEEWAKMAEETADQVNALGEAWYEVPEDWTTHYRVDVDVVGDPLPNDFNALGGVYNAAGKMSGFRVNKFALGGVVSGPTLFPYRGGIGMMGEAGAEAILPLRRDSSGRLGVIQTNASGGHVVNFNIDARGAAPGVEQRILHTIQAYSQTAAAHAVRQIRKRLD